VDLTVTETNEQGADRLQGTGGTLANQSYGSAHTVRWKSQNTTSCVSEEFAADKAKNNTQGVSTGGLYKETHTYRITCNTVAGAVNLAGEIVPSVTDTVTVSVNKPTLSCTPDKRSVYTGETIVWTAAPNPFSLPSGIGSYSYSWTGAGASPASQSGVARTYEAAYNGSGSYETTVTLTAPGSRTATEKCVADATAKPPVTTIIVLKRPVASVDPRLPTSLILWRIWEGFRSGEITKSGSKSSL
jgi:hypothetical protein